MKKNLLYIAVALLISGATPAQASKKYDGYVDYGKAVVEKKGGMLTIDIDLDLSRLDLGAQQMIVLTPFLKHPVEAKTHLFQPVVVAGNARWKTTRRAERLGDFKFADTPETIIRYNKKKTGIHSMTMAIPFKEWMRDSEFMVAEEVSGCGSCDIARTERILAADPLPPLFIPEFRLAYVTPPVEEVKQRSESYTSRLNFEVGKSVLKYDYKDNARLLAESDRIISEIKSDPNLTIQVFMVVGYASPEGNPNNNLTLSRNRAMAFVDYVRDRHGLGQGQMNVEWKGEDWEGLRKAVAASGMYEKSEVLRAIDTPDLAQRKQRMQALGSTYRMLLDDYYPPLRRNEYTIAYVARPFSVDEAKLLLYTKPQHLSLNEMFLVASTYSKESEEFKEVFDIASRMYPDSPVAIVNAGTLDIEKGALDSGMAKLREVQDIPQALNNVGVAYTLKGDYASAETYFAKAAAAGDPTAIDNLAQIERWKVSDQQ